MSDLPPLRGSNKQVAWARTIRENAFSLQAFSPETIKKLETIDDATWWIANRASGLPVKLVMTFNEPHAHQCVGGPQPPATKTNAGKPRAGDEPETEEPCPAEPANSRPHEAELFAASVCRHPLLAEIAVTATLARLYKGPVGDMLKARAREKLERAKATIYAEIKKDIDGLERILR
jgi:hypothetical protein